LKFTTRCKIVAIVDIYEEKASAQIQKYGLEAKVYKDYKDMLLEDIDLISICTPPYTHAALTVECLEADKHVLVEKPMASSLAECDLMNEAAQRTGKLLSVVAQNRFRTPMMKLKSVIDSSLMG